MKYPIGIQDFRKIREDGYVYIDKTALIHDLVKNGAIYFLSRPRRFGKSLLVSTLKYYFLGEKELFKGLAIDTLETEWKQYPVFHLDFNGSNFTDPQELERKVEAFVARGERLYGGPSTIWGWPTGSPMCCMPPMRRRDCAASCSSTSTTSRFSTCWTSPTPSARTM